MNSKLYNDFLASRGVATSHRDNIRGKLFFAVSGGWKNYAIALYATLKGARRVYIKNALPKLQTLATEHRRRLGIPVVAITGSNGKTTTKELAAAVLSHKYHIYYTHGNLNNHIGVPLTLLAMTAETELGIVEMGASAQGEIARLCAIAQPTVGVITNIGRAHLDGFGGEEGVRRGKGELYDFLAAHDGTAIVREDDPTLAKMAQERPNLKVEKYNSQSSILNSQLAGAYNIYNIGMAVAIGRHFGVAEADIADAIANYTPTNNRSQRIEHQAVNLTIIADCYNANPSSMTSALDSFAAMDDARPKIAILGDMLELGEWSAAAHREIVERLADTDMELWTVGRHFQAAHNGDRSFPDINALLSYLKINPLHDALVLVKGSHGIHLDRIITNYELFFNC